MATPILSRPGGRRDRIEIRLLRRRKFVGVTGERPAHHVEVGGRVAHGAGVAEEIGPARPVVREGRERHAAARRLEAHDPAAGGGNADRPRAVARLGQGDHAGGDRHRRPAARSARGRRRRPTGSPWPRRARVRSRSTTRSRARSTCPGEEPARAQPPADLAVDLRHLVLQEPRRVGQRRAVPERGQFLEEERHPGERPGPGVTAAAPARPMS